MDYSFDSIPEEFLDPLVNDFAYDPIRLPLSEDPAQVLYNRRTLEKIWDNKLIALNPYTRQPFNIRNAIPQTELKQQMTQYVIQNNRNDLEVIPADYNEALSPTDMQYVLNGLVTASKQCLLASESSEEASWRVLWQKLNLLRLYCQYKAENIETFLSVKGYEYLLTAINPALYALCLLSIEDTQESCKEVAKIIDVVGIKDSDLPTVPLVNILTLLHILADLVDRTDLKIQCMVLRIYLRMYDDCTEYVLRRCAKTFNILSFYVAVHLLLGRPNASDITNEDLYNVTALLKAAWNRDHCINMQEYVDGIVKVVILCIARFRGLHEASTHRVQAEGQATFSNSDRENEIDEEEEKNIHMISRALDRGLFLIDCIVMHDVKTDPFVLEWKKGLQSLDIVEDIVRMVEHILDGCKFFQSSHLQYGLNITALLCREEGSVSVITRNKAVKVFGDFLESDFVNEYDPQIKLLLEDIVRSCS